MTAKNPYAAAWEQAEHSLRQRIAFIHETGVTIDRARDDLKWQGAGADRFRSQANARHDALEDHNNHLRDLLELIRRAAEVKPPKTPRPEPRS